MAVYEVSYQKEYDKFIETLNKVYLMRYRI
jgi:hypothetical protein